MNISTLAAMKFPSAPVDQSAIRGEPYTGYENGGAGPFACMNCNYFSGGTCSQSIMKKFSALPRARNGSVEVDPMGCCEYIFRKGK